MTTRALRVLLWGLALTLFAHLAWTSLSHADRPTHGFATTRTAARLLRAGEPVARFYDDAWFAGRVEREIPGVRDIFTPNPPTFALAGLPVSGLEYTPARRIVLATQVALLAAALVLLVRELELGPVTSAVLVCLASVCRPVRSNLALAQSYVPLLFLLVLAFVAARRRRDGPFGASIALMTVLKTVGPLVWLWTVAARRPRAAVWGVAVAGGIVVLTLPWIGPRAWSTYLGILPAASRQPYIAVPAVQSQTGWIRRELVFSARFSPHPLVDAPRLAAVVTVAAGLLAAALALRAGVRDAHAVPALAVASTLVSPVSSDYAWCLAIPAIAILLHEAERDRAVLRTLLLCAAMGLFALAPERCDLPHPPFGLLATYPLVICGWILLALLATNRNARTSGSPQSRS